jgi:hypothetical protein
MASNDVLDVAKFDRERFGSIEKGLQYLTRERMTGAFDLPPFFRAKLDKND